MATTPTLRAKLDAGAWTTGAITATYSQTVSMSLASTAGYNGIRWEIYGFPPSWPCPSGWTEDPDNRIYYAVTDGSSPDPWDLPAAGTWGKWLLAAYPTGDTSARDIATAIEIVSPNGLHATPAHEGAQFGGSYEAWGKHVEVNWRTVDAGLGGAAVAILAANEAALTAADDGTLANGTRAYVASHRSTWHLQTSDAVGLTSHERIVGFTDGRVWQRELVRAAYYELQPEWWVDPAAGDDEATGATSGAPIKTLRELCRRVAPDGVWRVARAITVHVGNNYVGNTLPDVTIHTGTGAVTVTFTGWEANPNVHTQYTVDSAVAPVPSTNQRNTATMTAAVSDWTVGDIVRDESNNGGDAYFTIGFIDGGVPERVELCQGVEPINGDAVIDPEAADTFRRVELAPLTLGGVRVIGGVPISIALCNVDASGSPTGALHGVKFIACKLANVWLGPGSAALGCSVGSNCRAMGSRDGSDGEYASLYRCATIGTFRVTTHCDLSECYIRSGISLVRYASVSILDPCQVHLSAAHGAVFALTDYAHSIDLSTQYSLYGSGPKIFSVGGQVCGGMIRMLSDGTSVAFAGSDADFSYASTGDDPDLFFPRPGSTAGNYPSCGTIINCADWVGAPFGGQIARNFYSDLMIVPVESAS